MALWVALVWLIRLATAQTTEAPTYAEDYYYDTITDSPARPPTRAPRTTPAPTPQSIPTPSPTNSPTTSDTPFATWLRSPRQSTPPQRRLGHSMQRMCDNRNSCALLVWGGTDGEETCFNDLYKFWLNGPDANTWQYVTPTTPIPPARYSHSSATDDEYRMIIWGGLSCQGDPFRDVWIWNNALNAWSRVYGPTSRSSTDPVRWLGGNLYQNTLLLWGLTPHSTRLQWQFDLQIYSWKIMDVFFSCPGVNMPCFPLGTQTDYISTHRAELLLQIAPSDPKKVYLIDAVEGESYVLYLDTQAFPGSTPIATALEDYVLFLRQEGGSLNVSLFRIPLVPINQTTISPIYEASLAGLGRVSTAVSILRVPPEPNPVVYIFGGEADSVKNDLYKLTPKGQRITMTVEEVHPSLNVPPPRAYHSAVLLDGALYIFGGRVGRDPHRYTSDLWKRSFAVGTNNVDVAAVAVLGEQPPGRAYHSAVAQGVRMIIFGGTNDEQYFADTWAYNLIVNKWVKVHDGSGVCPSPRAGHAAVFYSQSEHPFMYVIGGDQQGRVTQPDKLWELNLETYVWKAWTIKGENKWLVLPSAVLYKNLQSSSVTKWYLLVGGGSASEYERNGKRPLYYLDLEDYNNLEWQTLTGYEDSAKLSGYRMGVFDSMVVRVGGRSGRFYSTETGWARNLGSRGNWAPLSGAQFDIKSTSAPGGRLGHTVTAVGDALAVFGGSTSNLQELPYTSNLFTSDLWLLYISTVKGDPIPCARGTVPLQGTDTPVYSGSRCRFCKLGTYYKLDTAECVPCSPGRYGPLKGAVEAGSCLPCPVGSYASNTGQSACALCKLGSCTRIGSVSDFPDVSNNSNVIIIGTPEPVIKTADTISSQRLLLSIGLPLGLGACAIMVCIFFCCERRRHPEVPVPLIDEALSDKLQRGRSAKVGDESSAGAPSYKTCFQRFDWLHKPAKKRNSLGGCFTVLWIIAFVAWTLSVVIPVVLNNAIETRSILPAAFRGKKIDDKSVLVTITLSLSTGPCKCDGKDNKILPDEALGPNDEKDFCETNCTSRWTRKERAFEPGVYFVNFTFAESAMFAGSWNYSVRSDVGYEDQSSSVAATVLPPPGTLFRGSTPSVVSLTLQELHLRDRRNSKEELKKGYLVELQSVTLGDTVDYSQFHDKNGVLVSFELTVLGENYVEITIDEKLALSVAITIVLSILISAKSIVNKVLGAIEVLVPFAIKVICCKCRSDDFKKLAVAMELGTLMDDYEEKQEEIDKQLDS